MSRYSDESREQVRDAVNMIELVSPRSELRRAGANSYFGRCPFHDERTPSFHVRPDEKRYHCFGCGASGDPFTFVMETEGVDFRGALEALADRFGVTLQVADEDPEAAARRQQRERLHALLDRAAGYYERVLWESGEALDARRYLLTERGLQESVLRAFRVGYAPSAWDRMLLASRQAGFSARELHAAGLAQRAKGQGRLYDRFRARIMFPLADARGRVVGFGARATREGQQPKYLNTSESEIFHKGAQLFGIDVARAHASRAGEVVLAEGYTDVLALHQAGVRNVVGVMGTSLTEEQLASLQRVARTLLLALDADSAGQQAMVRAARIAAGRSLQLRVVPLPRGMDPADVVAREGPEAARALVERSVPFVEFQVERILDAADVGSADGRDRALAEVRPLLRTLPASILREELVRRVAGRLDLSAALTATLVEGGGAGVARDAPRDGSARSQPDGGGGGARAAAPPDRRERTERAFLALCLALPGPGGEALGRVDPATHFTSDLLRRAAAHLRDHLGDALDAAPAGDEELRALLAELSMRFDGVPVSETALALEELQLDRARVERQITAARTGDAGEGVDITSLAAERETLRRRIDETTARIEREGR